MLRDGVASQSRALYLIHTMRVRASVGTGVGRNNSA